MILIQSRNNVGSAFMAGEQRYKIHQPTDAFYQPRNVTSSRFQPREHGHVPELLSEDGSLETRGQNDGDLAGYPTLPGAERAFWTAGAANAAPGYAAVVNGSLSLYDIYNNDRNIVVYDSSSNATWASNTA
eukprot:Em0001g679a